MKAQLTRGDCRTLQGLLETAAQHLEQLEAIEREIGAVVGATRDEASTDIISDVVYSGAPLEALVTRLALRVAR